MQLRDKQATGDALRAEAEELLALCRAAGVPFVVNDDVEWRARRGRRRGARGPGRHGLRTARRCSAPTPSWASLPRRWSRRGQPRRPGADYLGVGGVTGTATKPEAGVLAAEEFRAIVAAVDIPVVAIGGVNAATVPCLSELDVGRRRRGERHLRR